MLPLCDSIVRLTPFHICVRAAPLVEGGPEVLYGLQHGVVWFLHRFLLGWNVLIKQSGPIPDCILTLGPVRSLANT